MEKEKCIEICENDKDSIGKQFVEDELDKGEGANEASTEIKTDTNAIGENDSCKNTSSRAPLQATKRRPDKDLNHDNWDQEDEPEEKGEFKKANSDQLKDRKILTARRKQKPAAPTNNPFGSLSLAFGSTNGNSGNPAPAFNFSFPTSTPMTQFNFNISNSNQTSKNDAKEISDDQDSAVIAESAIVREKNDEEDKMSNSVSQETDEVTIESTDKLGDSESETVATKT